MKSFTQAELKIVLEAAKKYLSDHLNRAINELKLDPDNLISLRDNKLQSDDYEPFQVEAELYDWSPENVTLKNTIYSAKVIFRDNSIDIEMSGKDKPSLPEFSMSVEVGEGVPTIHIFESNYGDAALHIRATKRNLYICPDGEFSLEPDNHKKFNYGALNGLRLETPAPDEEIKLTFVSEWSEGMPIKTDAYLDLESRMLSIDASDNFSDGFLEREYAMDTDGVEYDVIIEDNEYYLSPTDCSHLKNKMLDNDYAQDEAAAFTM